MRRLALVLVLASLFGISASAQKRAHAGWWGDCVTIDNQTQFGGTFTMNGQTYRIGPMSSAIICQ